MGPFTRTALSGAFARTGSRLWSHRRLTAILVACLSLAAGCSEPPLEYREVKRIDEKVSASELETFLSIAAALPEGKLPKLPPIFVPPPQWDNTRTLSVAELVNEERNALEEHWSVEWLADRLHRNRRLQGVLREHSLTTEQFLGLSLTIGIALSRGTLHDDQDLQKLLDRGDRALQALRDDQRPFNSLDHETMYHVLREAMWVTRVDRAKRLALVPPENVALAAAHHDRLAPLFPAEFTTNPLDPIADPLEERGMPFEVGDPSHDDLALPWDRDQAIIGTDTPDPPRRETRVPTGDPPHLTR